MAEYHVGCGIAGIYAGTLKKNGIEWLNKTDVTEEAIASVRDWLMMERGDKNRHGYSWKLKDGGHVRLVVEVDEADKCISGKEQ